MTQPLSGRTLRTVELPEASYDIIYNSYVLEHIQGSQFVLEKLRKWLKPNGILIVRIPDPNTARGWTTSNTPHWFHVFYYRYVLGIENAGKPGFAPYPTTYDKILSRSNFVNWCKSNNMEVVRIIEDKARRAGFKFRLIEYYTRLVEILSFGSLSSRHENVSYILKKGSEGEAIGLNNVAESLTHPMAHAEV